MSLTLPIEGLVGYSDYERAKWRGWVAADASRLAIPFQAGGRFPTIGSMFDHVFLVERRHLSRLQGATPPDTSGVAAGDGPALFAYADLVRADFRGYIADLSNADADTTLTVTLASGSFPMPRRRLVTHILLHEARHFAQVAYAARLAGHAPPGEHDLFYFQEG